MSDKALFPTINTAIATPSGGSIGQLGYKGEQGVVVAEVVAGGAADDAGLQRGTLRR